MSELDYTDALAAEYVLGTLDFEERTQARTLLDADEAFAAKVELWERRFGELHLMVEPVEPEAKIWARIKAKMSEVRQKIRLPQPEIPPPAPAATPAEPPSLDAIEAAISQATTTLTSEATSASPPTLAPTSEVTRTPASETTPAPASEATSAAISDTTPVPPQDANAAQTSAMEPVSSPPVVPPPSPLEPQSSPPVVPPSAAAALPAPGEARTPAVEPATAVLVVHRRMRRWRAFAIMMTLVVAAVAALLAAWRFAPDRVPPMLQPVELMRQVGVTLPAAPAPRRPAPPASQFDE
jgi:hypothetical protein